MRTLLRIGGITIDVASANPALSVRPQSPVDRFAIEDGLPDLRVTVEWLGEYKPPLGPLLFDSGAVWRLFREDDGYRIECRSDLFGNDPYKIAWVTEEIDRVRIGVRPLDIGIPDALEFPLDELLVNALLVRREGIELHACGVIDEDGAGLLFPGNSGGGKTTTARLWAGTSAVVVSDDRVIVRREAGEWWMYGTPWHGEAEICSPRRAPLQKIFLLDKSDRNEAAALPAVDAVARLLSCAFPPFHDPLGLESVLALLDALCHDVPAVRFAFRNDGSAVDAARAATRLHSQ